MGVSGGKAVHRVISFFRVVVIVKREIHLFNIMHLTLRPILTLCLGTIQNFCGVPCLTKSAYLRQTFSSIVKIGFTVRKSLKLYWCPELVCVNMSGVGVW